MSEAAHRRRSPIRRVAAAMVAAITVLAGLSVPAPSAAAEPPPVRVIVELAAPPALAELADLEAPTLASATQRAVERADELARDHQDLLARADADGVELTVVHALTAAYNGLVVRTNPGAVAALAELPGVRAVHPDTSFAATLDYSVPHTGAPQVWQRDDPAGQPATGAGMTVAILDTGVDYRHPDLGGGFGPGHKVVAGHDFVNGDTDPMDDNGHGTHVAGIVAADGEVRGVAPDAQLTAYKVLDDNGSGQVSDILAGLDAAVHPSNPYRADVVNLSLSGPGDGTDPMSVAADLVVRAGVVVVASAGNQGPVTQSVRSPAVADRVLAVGATVSGVWVPRARMVTPVERDLRAARLDLSADPPTDPHRLAVVDVGEGRPADYEEVDVAGKAVLISGPVGSAPERGRLAERHGAAAALFYEPEHWGAVPEADQVEAPTTPHADRFRLGLLDDGRFDRLVALSISGASAATVLKALADGPVTMEITVVDATDQLADFSSRGPGGRYHQKPELTAPGVAVRSTLPGGEHGRGSGTSMAAPHVAAAAALLRQLHPRWTPAQVTAALATSAHRLAELAPAEQGAGRLDLPAAADTTVLATPHTVSFGLAGASTDPITRTRTLTLANHGHAPTRVSLDVDHHGSGGTVTVAPRRAKLAPGEEVEVTVQVTLAAPEADQDVSGWLTVAVSDAPTLTVPFLLAVRHLGLHVTPDPAPAGAQTTAYLRSPAELTSPPELSLSCPGQEPFHVEAEPAGTQLWRAALPVGEAGLCELRAAATADQRYGSPQLTGVVGFQSLPPPGPGGGAGTWQSVGPHAQAGWLAFGTSRDRVAVVPFDSPGVFVSDDGMRTWQELRTMPMAGGAPIAVAVHPRHSDTMFVAVNGAGVDSSYRGRILHTRDGGRSWDILPGPDRAITDLALDPSGTVLAVADDTSLRLTDDLGETWTERAATWTGLHDIHWIKDDLYLGTYEGLLRLRDPAAPTPSKPEVLLTPEPLGWADQVAGDESTLLVSSLLTARLYASYDGGETFDEVLNTPGTRFLAVELIGDELYATQASGLWVSPDRGATWQSWGDPLEHSVEIDVATWPGSPGTVYVASAHAGLYATEEPGQFRRIGVPGARVLSLATAADDGRETLVAGTTIDTFHAHLPGGQEVSAGELEWHSHGGEGFTGVDAPFLAASPSDPSVVYKVRVDAFLTFGIFRSDDGGATWRRLSSPTNTPFALLVHPADPDRVYVSYHSLTGSGLVMSTDGGRSWEKVEHGQVFEALAGDPTDPDRIWAGDREGLHLSEDGGLTFRKLADVAVTAIAVAPDDPSHLVIGGRGLYVSHDGGHTVRPADHVGLDMWVADVSFGQDGRVFAATTAFYDELGALRGGRGVLASGDGGESWEIFDSGLANRDATSLAFSGDGAHLYVGTLGGSVYRIALR